MKEIVKGMSSVILDADSDIDQGRDFSNKIHHQNRKMWWELRPELHKKLIGDPKSWKRTARTTSLEKGTKVSAGEWDMFIITKWNFYCVHYINLYIKQSEINAWRMSRCNLSVRCELFIYFLDFQSTRIVFSKNLSPEEKAEWKTLVPIENTHNNKMKTKAKDPTQAFVEEFDFLFKFGTKIYTIVDTLAEQIKKMKI